jgi:hypothetical protein
MEIITSMNSDSTDAISAHVASQNLGPLHDRRRAPRYRILTPAYANRSGSSQGAALELSEILNLSESGMCIQASSQLKVDHLLPLGIDLAGSGEHIRTVGHVAWSEPSGKTGIRFPEVAEGLHLQLRHWLAANARPQLASASDQVFAPAEWEKIQREVEHCGPDLEAALHLIAQAALTLTSASGAAIALISPIDPTEMICRARVGADSPDMGARLDAGAGFSGQCVTAAVTLRCTDSETDSRVDRESCRRLGIRSIVACPVMHVREVVGILEVFSPQPAAFGEKEIAALEKLADILEHTAERAEANPADLLSFPAPDVQINVPPDFAINVAIDDSTHNPSDAMPSSFDEPEPFQPQSRLRRVILLLLTALLLLGSAIWLSARWMTANKKASAIPSALSSSTFPAAVSAETYIGADLKTLQVHADAGDAAAEYRLGVRYATGEDVTQDYSEAMRWFLQAADQGNVRAQATVAAWMLAGRGAAQDYSQAYYWALLAQAGGDESGRVIVLNSAPYLSPVQTAAAQKQAEDWLHTHHIGHAPPDSAQ